METNQIEYQGEKILIRWGPKEEIFYMKLWGDHDKKDAKDFMKNFYEIVKRTSPSGPLFILVDVLRLGKITHEARRIYATEPSKHFLQSYSAICGPSTIIRLMIGFITTILKKNVKAFATTQEGLKWLQLMKAKNK